MKYDKTFGSKAMLLRQIRYFQAVVEHHSFSEAAEACHISQSAISQQVKALETQLGTPLLNRHNRTFSLTTQGEYFYKKSLIIVSDLQQLVQETARIAKGDSTHLRIGYLKSYGGTEFQVAAAAFSKAYPAIPLRVTNGNHEDLYDALRTDKVDLVFNDQRRAFSGKYVNMELAECIGYIEVAADHPLAKLAEIEIDDLKNTTCILVAGKDQQQTEQTYYHDIIGFQGEFIFADTLSDARIMVASHLGFLPIEGVQPHSDNSTIKRVALLRDGLRVTRNYCAFWKKGNPGTYIKAFAKILQNQFNADE